MREADRCHPGLNTSRRPGRVRTRSGNTASHGLYTEDEAANVQKEARGTSHHTLRPKPGPLGAGPPAAPFLHSASLSAPPSPRPSSPEERLPGSPPAPQQVRGADWASGRFTPTARSCWTRHERELGGGRTRLLERGRAQN